MTTSKKRLLRARIALALRDELGRQPTLKELDSYTRLASVLFKSVGGVIAMKSSMKRRKQLALF